MARPSLKEERREQILDAFEACVARYGVEGATLEKVAKKAGLARALIRHNVGNREELLEALVERFLVRSKAASINLFESLPKPNSLEHLVDWLFDSDYSDPQLVLVSEALIAESADNPDLAKKMRKWTIDFASGVEKVILLDHPNASKAHIVAVASGITGIYFTVESMSPLGGIKPFTKNSKLAVNLLIKSL